MAPPPNRSQRIGVLSNHVGRLHLSPRIAQTPCASPQPLIATLIQTAVELFKKDGGKSKDLEIQVVFQAPDLGLSHWMLDRHESLETYLHSVPGLAGYDASRAKVSFDKDHQRTTVNSADDFLCYLKLSKPGPLYCEVPEMGLVQKMNNCSASLAENVRSISARVKNYVFEQVSKSKVDEAQVKKEEAAVSTLAQCGELEHTGDVKQFDSVSMDVWKDFVGTLEKDGVPAKIISGLSRAAMAQRTNEVIYDLVYKNGCLEHAYLVRLLTMKTAPSEMQVVLFSFNLAFKSISSEQKDGSTSPVPLSLNPGQTLAIERFVGKASQLFWKDKLLAVQTEEDAGSVF